jgi:membrane protease YdiL (CAAX protease family)
MTSSAPPPEAPPELPPPAAPPAAPEEPQWQLWMAPAAVALGFGLGLIGTVLVGTIGAAAGASTSNPPPAVNIASDIVFDFGFVASALYFSSLRGPPRPAYFGFRWPPLRLGLTAFVLAALGYYLVTDIYANLIGIHGSEKLPSGLGVGKSTAALVGAAVFVCVIAPIAEEFFFRGFLFGVLRRWRIVIGGRDIGTWVAAVVVGILFGLAHTGSASARYLIPLGFFGFVLCLVRWRTGSLYVCIALHSVNNSLALGVNALNWNGAEVLGLMVGSLLVIGAATGPLAERSPRRGAGSATGSLAESPPRLR